MTLIRPGYDEHPTGAPPAVTFRSSAATTPTSPPRSDLTVPISVVEPDARRTTEYPALPIAPTAVHGGHRGVTGREVTLHARAPRGVRLAVGALAITAGGAVWIAHTHPGWLPRDVLATASPPAVHATHAREVMRLEKVEGNTSVYAISAPRYSLSITVGHACWVMVRALPSEAMVFTATLSRGTTAVPTSTSGTWSVAVAAQTDALSVMSGGKIVGIVHAPVIGHKYVFEGVDAAPLSNAVLTAKPF